MQCAKTGAEVAASTDSAILAAENLRLVQELEEARQQLKARTNELRESIQQQTLAQGHQPFALRTAGGVRRTRRERCTALRWTV